MGLRRPLGPDGFAFRGNPSHNKDPGIEATRQILVSPLPSALVVKLPRTQLMTKGGQHLLRMMWEAYSLQGRQCQASQQPLQKAREEIALEGPVGGHPYYDKWSNLGVSQRLTAQQLVYLASVLCNPGGKLQD